MTRGRGHLHARRSISESPSAPMFSLCYSRGVAVCESSARISAIRHMSGYDLDGTLVNLRIGEIFFSPVEMYGVVFVRLIIISIRNEIFSSMNLLRLLVLGLENISIYTADVITQSGGNRNG